MITQDFLLDHSVFIRCPRCHRQCEALNADTLSTGKIIGTAICRSTNCSVERVEFNYTPIYERFNVYASDHRLHYTLDGLTDRSVVRIPSHERDVIQRLLQDRVVQPEGGVFIVFDGEGEDRHIVQIFTSAGPAQEVVSSQRGRHRLKVEAVDCDIKNRLCACKVFVVSVGEGKQYRVVEVTTNQKRARDIATSIRGAVSMYEALPSRRAYQEVRYYKFFVNFDRSGGRDRSYYVDSFSRREEISDGQPVPPMVTHRRRYNSSLPHRLEVAATDEHVAEQIASQFAADYSVEDARRLFEYNVDYQLEQINGRWEVKPCLLEVVEESST